MRRHTLFDCPKNGGKSEKKKLEKNKREEKQQIFITFLPTTKVKVKRKGERKTKTVFGRAKNAAEEW